MTVVLDTQEDGTADSSESIAITPRDGFCDEKGFRLDKKIIAAFSTLTPPKKKTTNLCENKINFEFE